MLRFKLLGPLELYDGGPVPVSGRKLRALLSALLFHANQPVPTGVIQAALWGEHPPASVGTALQNHVARLRRLLGEDRNERVEAVRGGYRIRILPGELDLDDFASLVHSAQQARVRGDWSEVVRCTSAAEELWRATPLADDPVDVLQPQVYKLVTTRTEALEWYFDASLRQGRLDGLASRLAGLVREHPLNETLAVQYMQVLHRTGRRAQALEAFQRLRRALVAELGIEPGSETQRMQQEVLAAESRPGESSPGPATLTDDGPARGGGDTSPSPSDDHQGGVDGSYFSDTAVDTIGVLHEPHEASARARPIPRQLPAAPRFFVGRESQTAALSTAVDHGDTVVAIVGPGGIGKTALALAWSHQIINGFPHGQLYADLHGFSPTGQPHASADVLTGFLHALGVPAHGIPDAAADRAALYRTLTAELKLLIVLDNAADSEQVKDLLPGGASCLTVVTSRNRLAGLVATAGARPVRLDPLDDAGAFELFRARLGDKRVADELPGFQELAAACGGFPLALAIVAARLALEPDLSTADLAENIGDARTRFAALDLAETAAGLRDLFSWSHRRLSSDAASVFGILGLHPGPSVASQTVAILAGLPQSRADAALRELAAAHLVVPAPDGRIRMHDLIRLFAAETAEDGFGADVRCGIRQRMFDHYVYAAEAADRLVSPTRPRVDFPRPMTNPPGDALKEFEDATAATAWLELERAVLIAVSDLAAAGGRDESVWRLSWSLTVFLDRRGDWQTQLSLQERALDAAGRLDRPELVARTHCEAATACWRLGRLTAASDHLAAASAYWQELGDHAGLARVAHIKSMVCESNKSFREAFTHSVEAVGHARTAGDAAGEGMALAAVAWYAALCGEYETALDYGSRAVAVQRGIGYETGAAYALDTMGMACHRLGRHNDALAYYGEAAAGFEAGGERYYRAQTLIRMAEIHSSIGEASAAARHAATARTISDTLFVSAGDQIREALDRLEATTICAA